MAARFAKIPYLFLAALLPYCREDSLAAASAAAAAAAQATKTTPYEMLLEQQGQGQRERQEQVRRIAATGASSCWNRFRVKKGACVKKGTAVADQYCRTPSDAPCRNIPARKKRKLNKCLTDCVDAALVACWPKCPKAKSPTRTECRQNCQTNPFEDPLPSDPPPPPPPTGCTTAANLYGCGTCWKVLQITDTSDGSLLDTVSYCAPTGGVGCCNSKDYRLCTQRYAYLSCIDAANLAKLQCLQQQCNSLSTTLSTCSATVLTSCQSTCSNQYKAAADVCWTEWNKWHDNGPEGCDKDVQRIDTPPSPTTAGSC